MRIVVAGGGLVGLTLARLLRARGLDPVVVERMDPGAYVARGFMLGHHGFDALEELGLLAAVRAAGRPIAPQPGGGCAAIAVGVGHVVAALAEGLTVLHGASVTGLLRDASGRITGARVETGAGGREIGADLVVACDGARSGVRRMAGLPAEELPMEEGKIEWMSPVPVEAPFDMAYLADGGHIGLIGWPEGSFGWRTTARVGREAALAPGLEALAASWSALLPAAAAGVRGLTSMEQVHYSEPVLLRCPRWWTPGVVLIGDAAHFFGPETGASAGVGMADALALAQAVAAHRGEPDAACAAYEAWRGPAARPLEAADPGLRRLRGTPLPPGRPGGGHRAHRVPHGAQAHGGDAGRAQRGQALGQHLRRPADRERVDEVVGQCRGGPVAVAGEEALLRGGGGGGPAGPRDHLGVVVAARRTHAADVPRELRADAGAQRADLVRGAHPAPQPGADVQRRQVRCAARVPAGERLAPQRLGGRGGEQQREPALGDLCRQRNGPGAQGGDVDGHPFADGPRDQAQRAPKARAAPGRQRDAVGAAGVDEGGPRPQGAAHLHRLAQAGQRHVERHAVQPLHHLRAGGAETEQGAAAGERVQAGRGLGDQRRAARVHRQHPRPQQHALRARREEPEQRGRVGAVGLGHP
ncbi:MAG TPA: FAD-dependent monooxygenase [Miltoncostaeaceae bacterium]|nr:FAD-dependent monooxygenase [Miltoncostaeaceae bacterium]